MIATPRTFIRPIEPADSNQVFSYRSDAVTNQYQGWIPKSIAEVDDFIAKNPSKFNQPETWFQLVIIENNSQNIIGDIGIHFIDTDNLQCEFGITLDKKFHSQGFAIETMQAVIDYLFGELQKHRIIASIDPRNTGSLRLIEKLKFRKEAHFKKSILINGEWVDDLIFAKLHDEWKEEKSDIHDH